MRRSPLKPRKTTFVQRQKTHRAPTYNVCVNCGFNTDHFITDWDEILEGKDDKRHPFEGVILRRYGQRHPSGAGIRVLYFCAKTCIKEFIERHKMDILEEITK